MKNTKAINKRMFVVKYLSATNTRGTRIRITDTRHRGKSIIKSWDYSLNGLTEQAINILLNEFGIIITGYSEPFTEMNKVYLFTDNFSSTLENPSGYIVNN